MENLVAINRRLLKMIKKLYEKSEIWFAISWIILYCVLSSIGDRISLQIGILKIITLPILISLTIVMYLFLKKYGLIAKYGLRKPQISNSKMLFYIPLMILITVNLWSGIMVNYSPLETVLFILSMLFVGFLEEMIFRGFLFNALMKDGIQSAIIISSVTFGIGHIVNLFNGSGADFLSNFLQLIYAFAIGFTFVMIYYKTQSLLPCIVTHGLFNAAGAFANKAAITTSGRIATSVLIVLIAGSYALYLILSIKNKKNEELELQKSIV